MSRSLAASFSCGFVHAIEDPLQRVADRSLVLPIHGDSQLEVLEDLPRRSSLVLQQNKPHDVYQSEPQVDLAPIAEVIHARADVFRERLRHASLESWHW